MTAGCGRQIMGMYKYAVAGYFGPMEISRQMMKRFFAPLVLKICALHLDVLKGRCEMVIGVHHAPNRSVQTKRFNDY